MLAYAPRPAARSGSPRTLVLVAAGHVVAIALVLTARSEYVSNPKADPPDVIFIDPVKPPPPPPPPTMDPAQPRQSQQSTIDRPPVIIPTPGPAADRVAEGPAVTTFDPVIGNAVEPQPLIIPEPRPVPAVVRKAARFITPADRIRPPYPASKQSLGEEAKLRLSLAIDTNGRVTSVTPVGAADNAFLEAARRHIVRHWRYQPATEGGTAIASTIVVTLTFTLEE
ncbi:MAG: TonB family protein [Pseudomonadota bacterium]|nr:TonB family protein [Pseudomonadota bacterium]